MYKSTLILKGMLGVPASPTVTTVAGMTQDPLVLTGTRPINLTIVAPIDLTMWQGG